MCNFYLVLSIHLPTGYTCPDLLSACCMYDCSSLKCQRCIQKYCCCCISTHTSDQTYPHIAYGRIQLQDKENFEGQKKVESAPFFHCPKPVEKGIKSVPYQTIFQYPQPQQQYSMHPQLGQSSQFDSDVPSIVSQQPHLKEYNIGNSDSDEPRDFMSKEELSDYSPYGSMDDIGAKIGFVDMAKSSMYVGSNEADSLCISQRCENVPGFVCGARSTSPLLPSLPSVNDMGMELQKKSLQPIYPSAESPCIHFSLYHDESNQKLILHLKQAFKLPTNRPIESSNPFAEIYLLPKKNYVHKSRILLKTHNPVFDETFKFTNLSLRVIRQQTILMRLYINERSHFIGGLFYPLESASMNGDLIKVAVSIFDEKESLKVRLLSTTLHVKQQ